MKKFLISLLAVVSLATAAFVAEPASAIDIWQSCSGASANTAVCQGRDDSVWTLMRNVINLLLTVIGIVAVIMIIVGAIRFTTSNGDPKMVNSGRDTVIYSIVGLVVAMMAFAIVNWVIGRI